MFDLLKSYQNAVLRVLKISIICIISILPLACADDVNVHPLHTTYPRDESREQWVIMPVAPPLSASWSAELGSGMRTAGGSSYGLNLEWERVIVGESGRREISIVPNSRISISPNSTIEYIKSEGSKTCPGEFIIVAGRIYSGTEQTSQMKRINKPWITALVHCAPEIIVRNNSNAQALLEFEGQLPISAFFDMHQHFFPVPQTKLDLFIAQVVARLGGNVSTHELSDSNIMASDVFRLPRLGDGNYRQFVGVTRSVENGTVLTWRYISLTGESRGDLYQEINGCFFDRNQYFICSPHKMGHLGPTFYSPRTRDFSYRESLRFLQYLSDAVVGSH